MSEPVAVPKVQQAEPVIEKSVKSAVDEGQILDEGLDLSGYRGTHGSPFVADYFGIRDLYKTNPEISKQVDSVTEYLISKTDGESIVYAVKDILDQMNDELNLEDKDSGIYKLRKILDLVSAKSRLEGLQKMQAQALADIESML